MSTESTMSHCWKAKGAWVLLMCSMLLCLQAPGQATAPRVTSGVSSGLAHTTTSAWGKLNGTAITTNGDWLVQDTSQGALYEFPADGSAMITLLAPGTLGSDPGLALDANNTLYLEGNWANCILRFPYDSTSKTWTGLSAFSPSNGTANCNGFVQYNLSWPDGEWGVQPKGLTTDTSGNIIVGAYNNNYIARIPVSSSGVPSNPTVLMYGAAADPISVAIDKWNNVYFVEDQGETGALPGVYEIPAGSANIAGESSLTRIDPDLPAVTAVATDPEGNVYVSDGSLGVFLIPSAGAAGATPQTANAVLLTSNAAQGAVSIDWSRQILYVPTTTTQTNGQADVAEVKLGKVDLGSIAVGTSTSATPVSYVFNGSVTPNSFVVEEDGGTTDFSIAAGGTCHDSSTPFVYSLGGACTVNIAANPAAVGSVSAKLLMLDSSNNILASTSLHSVGLGSAVSISPATESAIGSGFSTPSQVAVDASGNTYVADAGLGKVLMYAKGSSGTTAGVAVGTGLTAPTGVAADGAGDVFIADSGNIIEVPYSPSGLNAAGQVTIKSGLGSNLRLAADGAGNIYVADPDNARVVDLGQAGATAGGMLSPEIDITGFTAPSAVGVDASNNVYVLDNQNLLELQPDSTPTTVISSLGAATGLAFDPSGALYVTLPGGTERIPSVAGVLTQSAETAVATSVTTPSGIAIDKLGNIYIGDATAENLHFVSIDSALAFGTVSDATTEDVSLLNFGNSSLTVNGFSSSDTEDFAVSGCTSAVSAGGTCDASVTLTPGPGVQGAISSTITVDGNESNTPVVINATATGSVLANSGGVTIAVASSANVISVPVTVTVAPSAGGAMPTGTVIVTVDSANPTSATLSGGTATITLTAIPAGSHTFAVTYVGDRTYGSATASITATVARAAVVLTVPAFPSYVLSTLDGEMPYDSSLNSYITNYVVTVIGAPALPPTGTMAFNASGSACVTWPMGTPAPGEANFQPGCLPITTNSNAPNELTQQTITSITYSGDANYLSATATTTSTGGALTFGELRQPSVALAPNPGSLTVSSGTGSTQLSISSVLGYGVSTNPAYPSSTASLTLNNYTLPVGFACQGLPAYASCTFSGGNYTDLNGVLHTDEDVIDTDPSKPVTITVTVHTNISTTANKQKQHSPISVAVLLGFGLIGLVSRRRFKDARLFTLFFALTLAGAAVGLTSCTGNNFSQESSATTTPAGTYAVTITAQQVGSTTVMVNGVPTTLYGNLNQVSLPYTLEVTVQ